MLREHIIRLQKLAGIILEIDDSIKTKLYAKSGERVAFNREMIKKAIENGEEVGILFKSKNEKYEMPMYKYRIIQPIAYGISKAGKEVIRGFHIIGQSEKVALETGRRSAEAQNVWRLFKTENIRGIWLTGRHFDKAPTGYNPSDKGMSSIITRFNAGKAKKYQDSLKKPENPENTDV